MSPNTWISNFDFLAVHRDTDLKKVFVFKYTLVGNWEVKKKKLFEAWWMSPQKLPFDPAAGCLTATSSAIYYIEECPTHGTYHHRIYKLNHHGQIVGMLTVPGKLIQISVRNSDIFLAHRSHRSAAFDNVSRILYSSVDSDRVDCCLGSPWLGADPAGVPSDRKPFYFSVFSEITNEVRILGGSDLNLFSTVGFDYATLEFRLQGPGGHYPDYESIKRAGESRIFHEIGRHYAICQNVTTQRSSKIAKVVKIVVLKYGLIYIIIYQ